MVEHIVHTIRMHTCITPFIQEAHSIVSTTVTFSLELVGEVGLGQRYITLRHVGEELEFTM